MAGITLNLRRCQLTNVDRAIIFSTGERQAIQVYTLKKLISVYSSIGCLIRHVLVCQSDNLSGALAKTCQTDKSKRFTSVLLVSLPTNIS